MGQLRHQACVWIIRPGAFGISRGHCDERVYHSQVIEVFFDVLSGLAIIADYQNGIEGFSN